MNTPIISAFVGIAILLLAGMLIGLGVWTYRDAKSRGLEAGMWTAIVLLVPNLIGLLLYFLIGRKQQKATCPVCGYKKEKCAPYCSNCGTAVVQQEQTVTTLQRNSKKPLVFSFICVVMTFVLIIGALLVSFYLSPEKLTSKNVTIGQTQTELPGVWKQSFWYFDGEKARAIKIKQGNPKVLNIDAKIKSGTVEMGITMDGKEEKRVLLNDLDSTYIWDLSNYPENARITLHLYADAAKGKVNMNW